MITGLETLRSIDEAYASARDEEMRLGAALSAASERAASLRRDRLAQLNALAQLKFDLIRSGELLTDLDAAEKDAKAALSRIHQAIEDASRRREQAASDLRDAEAEKSRRAADHEAAVLEFQALQSKVAAEIAEDPMWRVVRERLESLRRIVDQAEAKAAQAEADRERKRVPYEKDPLFMYLWTRKYGSPDYASLGFVRRIDGLVAKLVGFSEARRNYTLLNEIPGRLREHARRVAKELAAEKERLAALLQERMEKAGGRPLQERATTAKAALDESEARRAAASSVFDDANRSFYLLIGGDDEGAFAEAVRLMQQNDERDDVRTLYREAERTQTHEDQAIVKTIDELTKALARAEKEVADLRARLGAAAAKRAEIEQASEEFRRRRYDYPGTRFDNDSTISDVLGGVLKGAIAGAVLGQVLNQGYHGPPSAPWGGMIGSGSIFPPGGVFGGSSDEDFTTGGGF